MDDFKFKLSAISRLCAHPTLVLMSLNDIGTYVMFKFCRWVAKQKTAVA